MMILWLVLAFVAGVFFLPVSLLVINWLDDTVSHWWYNRPRK